MFDFNKKRNSKTAITEVPKRYAEKKLEHKHFIYIGYDDSKEIPYHEIKEVAYDELIGLLLDLIRATTQEMLVRGVIKDEENIKKILLQLAIDKINEI